MDGRLPGGWHEEPKALIQFAAKTPERQTRLGRVPAGLLVPMRRPRALQEFRKCRCCEPPARTNGVRSSDVRTAGTPPPPGHLAGHPPGPGAGSLTLTRCPRDSLHIVPPPQVWDRKLLTALYPSTLTEPPKGRCFQSHFTDKKTEAKEVLNAQMMNRQPAD